MQEHRLPFRLLLIPLVGLSTIGWAQGQSDTQPPPPPCVVVSAPATSTAIYEQSVVKAMDGETLALLLVADLGASLPDPIPLPQAAALSSIANDFQRLGNLIMFARSLRIRAVIGASLPDPIPQPPPSVLLAQASQVQQEALMLARQIQTSIIRLSLPDPIPRLTQLTNTVQELINAITNLPGPLPGPG